MRQKPVEAGGDSSVKQPSLLGCEALPPAWDFSAAAARAAETNMDQVVALLQRAIFAHQSGRPAEAVPLLRDCLAGMDERLGRKHIYTAIVLFQLALALDDAGQEDEAERVYRECLAVGRATAGLGHPKACVLMHSFTDLLRRRGKAAEAEALYKELIEAQHARSGGRFAADALLGYGILLSWLDWPADELTAYREALALFRRTGGPRRQNFLRCLNELAEALRHRGQPAEAEALLVEALPLARKRFGDRHAGTAVVLNNLAGVRLDQGRLPVSRRCWRRPATSSGRPRRFRGWGCCGPPPRR